MKSPIEVSKMIREKKKKLKDIDNHDLIDSGDSPSMDKTDIDILKMSEHTADLDENHPMHEAEEPAHGKEMAEPAQTNHEGENALAEDPELEMLIKRKARLAKTMGK